LALFGRRPPQRVDSLVMPASENLHRSGHPLAYSITTSATRHGSDVGSQHAETIEFCFKVAYFESASSAFGP
jgi:hypothetical protein